MSLFNIHSVSYHRLYDRYLDRFWINTKYNLYAICYVFIQASFDVLFSSIEIMLPVHLTQIVFCVEENYKIKSASFFIATDRRQW